MIGIIASLCVVTGISIHLFGFERGMAIGGAIYALMPYKYQA